MTIAAIITLLFGVLIILSIIMIVAGNGQHDDNWMGTLLISFGLGAFVLIGSLNNDNVINVEKQSAEVIKTFDNIVVKATDWPEQNTKDFQVLEKPVQIVRKTMTNSWGMDKTYSYEIEIIPVENEKK